MHKPLRLSILAAALAVSALLVMSPAGSAVTNFANAPSGAHYKNGFAEPVCTSTTNQNGSVTVSCTNTAIGGVGNTNADLSLVATATANFVCHNPGKKSNIVEPHSGAVGAENTSTLTPSRNGTLNVGARSVTISPQDAEAQFSCPNPNWDAEFVGFDPDVSFTYTLTFAGFDAPAISITG